MSIPRVPTRPPDLVKTAEAVNGCIAGKLDVVGSVTLEASVTTTVLNDNRLETGKVLLLIPMTANAAGALATTYVSLREKGKFTITHSSAGSADRTFSYAILG